MRKQSNIGSDQKQPRQPLPHHKHGKDGKEDDGQGNGEDVTFFETHADHGGFFDDGIFSWHVAALFEDYPGEAYDCWICLCAIGMS